ncbi:MAG: hypothetical protein O7G13_14285 [Alphaproteobacteria bacterium]|nr:hypothetical protein [Alphaproteobacteria bacterium]MCZ6840429.1 hypothetical protein [Alphaproteobacteria bacterium]
MNPELKRNLLIEITPQRLIAMPLILGLIFAAAWAANGVEFTMIISNILFWVFIFFWGTRKAAGAFDSELANSTWDSQRLSALSAAQIFIGKLFGSTSFVLYGALICLLVNAFAWLGIIFAWLSVPEYMRTLVSEPSDVAWSLVHDVFAGLLGLVIAMFVAIVLLSRTRTSRGISVTLCQVFAIGFAVFVADRFGFVGLTGFSRSLGEGSSVYAVINWFGLAVPTVWFVNASLLAFLLWAVLGTVRQLREVLQFRGYPWAWVLFVVFVGVYLAGFDEIYRFAPTPDNRTFLFLAVFWATAAVATYLAVLTESKSLQSYRSYAAAVRRLRLSDILEHQPYWTTSLTLVVLALVVNLAIGNAQNSFVGLGIHYEMVVLFGMTPGGANLKVLLVVASLFLVRDCLLVMTLNFGRRRRRADLAALVYLAVLYVVIPLVLLGFDLDQTILTNFFLPRVDVGFVASVWPVLLEIVGLAGVMIIRWRAVRQPLASAAA